MFLYRGKAILEGTRVPLKIILVDLSQGTSIQEICKEYDLTEEQVNNGIAEVTSRNGDGELSDVKIRGV